MADPKARVLKANRPVGPAETPPSVNAALANQKRPLAEADRRVTQLVRAAPEKVLNRLRWALRGSRKSAWWLIPKLPRKLEELRTFAQFFDADWYLATYLDVADAGLDPLSHYLSHGAAEGRDPGPNFSTVGYLIRNQDVAARGMNPLLHYAQFGKEEGREFAPVGSPESFYEDWMLQHEVRTEAELTDMRRRAADLPYRPRISILMSIHNTPETLLREAIESVLAQTYDNWELCIADDASTAPHIGESLRRYGNTDPRIKVVFLRENLRTATNAALKLATGEWVATLGHDDVLAPHALFRVATTISERPDVQLVYSDEDKIDEEGCRHSPFFKPDFSPELFHSQNYFNHLTAYRVDNVQALGGWREDFEGAQDYDLHLRISERVDPSAIHHIPEILYHRRTIAGSAALASSQKNHAYLAGLRALSEHVERLGLAARVEAIADLPYYRLRFTLPSPPPLVSIIIPTRDRADFLRPCVESILDKTTYERFEVLIIDNGSVEKETETFLARVAHDPHVRVLRYPHPFNYSAINNFGVRAALGEILAFLNDDTEVIARDWLAEMVSWAAQKDIGCVGAKLYYANDTIQHAGIILGIGEVAGHSHRYYPRGHAGYFGRLKVAQSLSAVTGACIAVRKSVFFEARGFNETDLVVAFNDVDFCLKVREAGYRNVWTPFAELYHHEGISRGHDNTPEKRARLKKELFYMKNRWGKTLENDPFYSPHLTREREDFSIASRWSRESSDHSEDKTPQQAGPECTLR